MMVELYSGSCASLSMHILPRITNIIYRSYRYKFHGHLIPSHIKRFVGELL